MKKTLKFWLGTLTVFLVGLAPSLSPVDAFVAPASAATVGSGSCQQTVGDATYVTASSLDVSGVAHCLVTFSQGSTTWTVPAGVSSIDYLIVGGGGGGGRSVAAYGEGAGGGGAGGLIYVTNQSVDDDTEQTIVVGEGGASWTNGSNSSAFSDVAYGGGRGGGTDFNYGDVEGRYDAALGGSGGGGFGPFRNRSGGNGTAGQGNSGGTGYWFSSAPNYNIGGGGGGAGGQGLSPNGGPGRTISITGDPVTYAEGGQGGTSSAAGVTPTTIGSGGGGGQGSTSSPGGSGNRGIVIVRYSLVPLAPTISSVASGPSSIDVTFSAPSHTGGSSITDYEYSFDGSTWTSLSTASAGTETISGLTNGTAYTVRLRAVNGNGNGIPVTAGSATTPALTSQTITFGSISDRTVGSRSFSVSPSSSSGLTVSVSSSDPSVCTVAGYAVSIVGAGTCELTASQGGDATYASASATQSFTVSSRGVDSVLKTGSAQKGLSSIAEVIPTSVVIGTGFTTEMWVYPDSLPNNWNTLLYQHSTANTTTNYDRFGMNIRGNGQVQVILDASDSAAPGNDILNYQSSVATVPTGEWTHLALVVEYTGAKQFQAEVFIDGVGLGVVTKNTTNDLTSPSSGEFRMGFNPAFASREFNGQIEQFKVWDVALTDAQVAASMNAYQDSANTPSVSSLRLHHDFDRTYGSTVVDEVLGDGTYDLTYATNAPSVVSLTPTISTGPSNASISALDTRTLSVSASAYGDLDYQWQQNSGSGWSNIAGATSSSYETPALGVSSSGIQYRVVVGSTVYYKAATATSSAATITVTKADQSSLSFTSASSMVFGQTIPLVATGGSGSGALSYAFVSGPCTVSGASVEATGAGSCVVTATRAGDDNYNAKTSSNFTITVAKANQSINFTSSVPVSVVSGTTYTPTASATSGLTPTFSITTGSGTVCSLASGVVTFLTSGTCVITATQGGNSNYNAASSVTQTIVAGKINQTITFPSISGKDFDDAAFLAGATVSSGRTVTFATTTGSVCAVNASTGLISIKTIGDCTVTASSAGNGSYAAASDVSRTFTISPVVAGKPSVTSVSFGNSSVTVAFGAPGANGGDSVDAYQVVATSSGGSVTKPDCSTTSPCTIPGLTNGDSYTLTVAAINAAGVGPASDASPAVIPATIPDAVSALSTTPGDEQLVVTWTALTNDQVTAAGGTFARYDVYLRVRGNSWGSPVTADGTNNLDTQGTSSYTFTGLTNGTAYDVKVVAITNANSTELSSNTSTALGVPATAPVAPTGLSVTALSNTTAVASWSAPVDDGGSAITGYSVNLSCTFVNATDTFCELSGLSAGSTVTVSVAAMNLMGTGSTVSVSITMPGGSSGSPGGGSSGGAASPATVAATNPPVLSPRRIIVPAQPTPIPRLFSAPVRILPERGFDPDAGSKARIAGQPATVTKRPLGDGGLSVEAGAFQLGITMATPEARASSASSSGTRSDVSIPTGQSTKVTGGGLLPGSNLQVWLPGVTGENPLELARIPVKRDGTFESELSFTARQSETPLPIGRQVLQVTGFDEDGNQTVVDMTINIGQGAPAPEPNRAVNSLPDLAPGQSLATSAGTPETVTIEARPEDREVAVLSGEWSFMVSLPEEAGVVEEAGSSATVTLIQARTATVSGDGFQPDTRVDIWLFSDPTLLGSVIVSADGSFTGEVYLDVRYAIPGEHTLQLQGVADDGFIKAANLGVVVQEPVEFTTENASSLLLWVGLAVILLLLAVLIGVTIGRRRQVSY